MESTSSNNNKKIAICHYCDTDNGHVGIMEFDTEEAS
jgi:hypothetical protein